MNSIRIDRFDCAGYTQQAFLAARGLTRAQAGFAPGRTEESLSKLGALYPRVAPEAARPGDIVVLDPPPGEPVGHRAVVYDCREMTPEEADPKSPVHGAALAPDRVKILTLDSSWGSGGHPTQGGVERRSFYYDMVSKKWAPVGVEDAHFAAAAYRGDTLRGIYRYPGKP